MIKGTITATNISEKKGTPKTNAKKITLFEKGVINDAHATLGHRQVSLLSKEKIDEFVARTGKKLNYGDFGENLTVSGIDLGKTAILDVLKINNAILEVTQIGKECHGDVCEIFRSVGKCIMPTEGVFCRVVNPDSISVGDIIEYHPRTLKILILTLSDRAAAGEYEDTAGEKAIELLSDNFAKTNYHYLVHKIILPDQADYLHKTLLDRIAQNTDIIFTLGGTGICPKDITPEVVSKICEKTFSGIMDMIRLKHGQQNKAALLSRSIAGIAKKTLIYTLPGSLRATSEYLSEIIPTLEHTFRMLHGIGH